MIQRVVGQGATARVHLARDIDKDVPVAIKMLRPELAQSGAAKRFLKEIKRTTLLDHPRILPVLDSGECDGQLYFVLPFMEGGTLRQRLLREKQLPMPEVIAILRSVADALDHAHGRGLVHLDVKPENILFSNGDAVLGDFGIARALQVAYSGDPAFSVGSDASSSSAIVRGTPAYMSPEQAGGSKEIDGRSDIYSLACVAYEMITGMQAFIGPTDEAVMMQHLHHTPREMRVYRPALPESLNEALLKAFALTPADRYRTAGDMVSALDTAVQERKRALPRRRRLFVGMSVGAVAVIALSGWLYANAATRVDANHIVVFPLLDPAGQRSEYAGEGIATYIWYALDGTDPLRWHEGWRLLDRPTREDTRLLRPRDARSISRSVHAGYYIDGTVLRRSDSVTVLLRLYSTQGDSLVATAGASGPRDASLPKLGLTALASLLPRLLAPGRALDLAALSDRHPSAIAHFLQGESEYRRLRFSPALEQYERAVQQDSALAIAALKGAQTAIWMDDTRRDSTLIRLAVAGARHLSPFSAQLARGLHAHINGHADTAEARIRGALRLDSTSAAAWTVLGEVYWRTLPNHGKADSIAGDAFERARRFDPDFAPALLQLQERALRVADVARAQELEQRLREAGADSSHHVDRDLMLRCVRDGPASVAWTPAAVAEPNPVLAAAKIFAIGAAQPACARAATRALVASPRVPRNYRWAGLVLLHGLAVAAGREDSVASWVTRQDSLDVPYWTLELLAAAAESRAASAAAVRSADSIVNRGAKAESRRLWIVGTYEASRGGVARVRFIASELRRRADESRDRAERLMADAMAAHQRLLEGDTTAAMAALAALRPTAGRSDLYWQPWESLGRERLVLARLQLARGLLREAQATAELLDAPSPATYLLYLRPSLEVRLEVARRMNDSRLLATYRARLDHLSAAVNE